MPPTSENIYKAGTLWAAAQVQTLPNPGVWGQWQCSIWWTLKVARTEPCVKNQGRGGPPSGRPGLEAPEMSSGSAPSPTPQNGSAFPGVVSSGAFPTQATPTPSGSLPVFPKLSCRKELVSQSSSHPPRIKADQPAWVQHWSLNQSRPPRGTENTDLSAGSRV